MKSVCCNQIRLYIYTHSLLPIRLVNIYNGTGVSNRGIKKGCECIDLPEHTHLDELLKKLTDFCEWKNYVGRKVEKYISWQSHEDLC